MSNRKIQQWCLAFRQRTNRIVTNLGYVSLSISLWLLTGCTGSRSPIQVEATISPEPVVGRDVTLHIEMYARSGDHPNATLEVYLPEGIELVSGDLSWEGAIAEGETVAFDLTISVITEGEWPIDVVGRTVYYADVESLRITSSAEAGEVVDIEDLPRATIPALQIEILPTGSPEP